MTTIAPAAATTPGSAIYVGWLMHTRFTPVRHSFRYPVAFAVVDVDEADALDRHTRLFGYNRARPFALRDRDYLGARDRSIGDNIRAWLADRGVTLDGGQIRLITNLRTLGYAFNPVSFFHCTDADGRLVCAVAEVSNTFGERRPYLLDDRNLVATGSGGRRTWSQSKELHVSPFFGMEQRYEFTLSDLGDRAVAKVDLFEGAERVLTATQVGERRPFDDRTLARVAARYPLMGQQVIGLIHLEALRLWRKRVPFHRKPRFTVGAGSALHGEPAGVSTAEAAVATEDRVGLRPPPPAPPQWIPVGLMRRAADWALSRPVGGVLELTTPDMSTRVLGDPAAPRRARLSINSRDLYRRLITRRRVAIGESYVAGDWDTDDLVAALEILILTAEELRHRPPGTWITRALELRPHRARANPPKPARRDIAYHYDLGNEVYQAFLDPTMSYSCAIFDEGERTLEEAQLAKHRRICDKLRLGPEDHLLEIGCGWGGFAVTAAQEYGARVTGVTISREQHDVAVARVSEAGLADRVTILLEDYRAIGGEFSKIASIEMFEAIGEAEYQRFFRTCDRLLARNGLACIQTIAMPDQRFERYRRTTDWLKEYIFPGSLLPSLAAITSALSRTQLMVHSVEDIGAHYVRTLQLWRQAFERNIADAAPELAADETFMRTWRFYLSACEAGFSTRAIHDYQLLLTRPYNATLPPVPVA